MKGFLRDNDGRVHNSLDKVCGGGFSWHWAGVGVLRFPLKIKVNHDEPVTKKSLMNSGL